MILASGGSPDMQADHDRTLLVRAELCERLAVLRGYCERRGPRDFARTVAGIRQLAAAYGLTPVVHLADALERAARGEQQRRARDRALSRPPPGRDRLHPA
jgi:hypothetical protein